ncbi:MAG: APC family permease [Actinomycetota bacterium]|nr:APC family permease [Actinomycetota bacterium]
MLLFFILGDILGAGIYALGGEVAGEVGGAVWTAFTVALVLALCTAFAYAELVTKYPHAGGAALFVNRAYRVPFVTFMVAFAVMASGITSASTLSRAFGGDYLREFIDVPTTVAALVFIVIVALINFRGISESVKTNMVLTVVELTGLVIIILIGAWVLGNGDGDAGRNFEFKEGETAFLAILAGTALAFYALIGFEDSANVAEEAQDPTRSFPFALFAGILIAGVIYFLVTFAASLVVPTSQLADSDGPLLEVVREGSDIPTRLFSAIALLAVANGALINMVMASRLLYGMANERILPRAFSTVHQGRRTPWVAIVFTTALAMILISIGKLEDLAVVTVMLLLIVFAIVNVAVLVLRRDRVDHRHFVAPSIFPILGVVISIVLLIKRITDGDATVLVITAVLLVLGAALWLATRLASGRDAATAD